MHTPVHSPWLPGYINVTQTVLGVLTMVGLFPDKLNISIFVSLQIGTLQEPYLEFVNEVKKSPFPHSASTSEEWNLYHKGCTVLKRPQQSAPSSQLMAARLQEGRATAALCQDQDSVVSWRQGRPAQERKTHAFFSLASWNNLVKYLHSFSETAQVRVSTEKRLLFNISNLTHT